MSPANAEGELAKLAVRDIPGIGYRTGRLLKKYVAAKLEEKGEMPEEELKVGALKTVITQDVLQSLLGTVSGTKIWESLQGIDTTRLLVAPTFPKSLGAEITWGVRFVHAQQIRKFIGQVAAEVLLRLSRISMKARQVTIKVVPCFILEPIFLHYVELP